MHTHTQQQQQQKYSTIDPHNQHEADRPTNTIPKVTTHNEKQKGQTSQAKQQISILGFFFVSLITTDYSTDGRYSQSRSHPTLQSRSRRRKRKRDILRNRPFRRCAKTQHFRGKKGKESAIKLSTFLLNNIADEDDDDDDVDITCHFS